MWLSTGKFSDDASPAADWNRVLNGDVARELGGVFQWSCDHFIKFHLTGKKAPKYYVYRKESDPVADYHTDLKFGDTSFIRDYEKRQLGIKVCFFRDDEKPNKYGYQLDWVGKRPLSSVANRLQEMRYVHMGYTYSSQFDSSICRWKVAVRSIPPLASCLGTINQTGSF